MDFFGASKIAHKYISLEWARRTVEYDLKRLQQAGLKYPVLFEEAAVRILDRLSIQMRNLKKEMHEKSIKVVYKRRRKELYDAIQYDLFVGRKHFPIEYAPERLKWMSFEEIEKS